MGRILEALADDNLCINSTTYNGPPKWQEAVTKIYETSEELNKRLNEEEKQLFTQFSDAQSEESYFYQVDRFVQGYRLGVLMMTEVFTEAPGLILDHEAEPGAAANTRGKKV